MIVCCNAGIPRRRHGHRHRLAKHGYNRTSDTCYFLARPCEEIACVGRKIVAVFGESVSVSVSVSASWNASLMQRSFSPLQSITRNPTFNFNAVCMCPVSDLTAFSHRHRYRKTKVIQLTAPPPLAPNITETNLAPTLCADFHCCWRNRPRKSTFARDFFLHELGRISLHAIQAVCKQNCKVWNKPGSNVFSILRQLIRI